MRLVRSAIWLLAAAGVVLLAGFIWAVYDWDRIDSCLDHGGSWDYQREVCDFEVSHPGPRP